MLYVKLFQIVRIRKRRQFTMANVKKNDMANVKKNDINYMAAAI